jgi:hypothetical protein
MPTARELGALIGKRVTLTTREGLKIPAKVVDARYAYGRMEVLVEPIHGTGRSWVRTDRIKAGK